MKKAHLSLIAFIGSALVLAATPFIFVAGGLWGSRALAALNSEDLGQVIPGKEVMVTALAADGSKIYLATTGAGAHFVIYDNGVFTDKGLVSGASEIRALAVATDTTVYLGTGTSSYLWAYHPLTDTFQFMANLRLDATSTGQATIWSMVMGDNGKLYAGTEPEAGFVSYTPGGSPNLLKIGGENKISGVVKGTDGRIYGGTSPNGVIFAFDPFTSSLTTITTLNADVTAIAYGPDNAIYAAGRNNRLYRVYGGGSTDLGEPVPGEMRISSLIAGGDGKIYGGTYAGGITFSYDPATTSFATYGPMIDYESDISALVWSNGKVYGGTAPVGHLFYIFPDRPTPTPTETATVTETPTSAATGTATVAATDTPTPTATATETQTPTVTDAATTTATPTSSPAPGVTATPNRIYLPLTMKQYAPAW